MRQSLPPSEPYTFTPAEMERLIAFKQAVEAGFYNEGYTAENPAPISTFVEPEPSEDASNSH